MNKTVAVACVVSAALFAAGFLLPQPAGRAGPTAVMGMGPPAVADLFDPQVARPAGAERARPF